MTHDADHHHHDEPDLPLEENPIWQQDNVTLYSVGIDIGSSGTQVAFSRLQLRRRGEDLTSRYVVVSRDTIYESEVHLTPYTDDLQIDAQALGHMLDAAYTEAGQEPRDVDTGVVILTGEALRRRNAERIASVVAERAGDLVCATAGHHMEAMLAAYGSGAALTSHEMGARILNVDIGGGTTKLALIDKGRVVATAAFHVGGRLIAVEGDTVTRIEPGGSMHAAAAGFDLALGNRVSEPELDEIASAMADLVIAAVRGEPAADHLYLTQRIGGAAMDEVDGIIFSGGVAEYVYGAEHRDFGDLGRRLGVALAARIAAGALPASVLPAAERIRATVLGASEYTVQLSGITSFIPSAESTLPRRNLQVARPQYELGETVDPDAVAASISAHLTLFGLLETSADVAVALHWNGAPSYRRLRAFAEGVVTGLGCRRAEGRPLYLMIDGDIALTLGTILRDELAVTNDLLILDGIALRDFDFVDLGRVREPSRTVPVTIKSLVFGADQAAACAPALT
ncbi:recombinase [Mycolicibacterium wolinskyi]|uniref:Recombinase n=1 Tax=Mycolicibacterium wolinskyi TaxID=59750 RepID=A0A132PIG6_9MYCO|nr:ethanolamine ammonia-lyase reactivating factor EutA [Mycolicibacterium wolinskyi]KWX22135.1 recombinase [Mycolicibacterium wolinskyi]